MGSNPSDSWPPDPHLPEEQQQRVRQAVLYRQQGPYQEQDEVAHVDAADAVVHEWACMSDEQGAC